MSDHSSRAVRLWLWTVAALIFAMVVVGGATRLTQSGLSIVEWRPVTGTLPPLTQAQWQAEFEKYQTIPQYQVVNRGMSLDEFKTIYWWEWAHRLLGRLIGAAFLLPFLWFLWRGAIKRELRTPLGFIFLLGAVQGGVGWWMVYSGLSENIHVSHYRLAFHLTLACVIFVAILWVAERLVARPPLDMPARIRISAVALMVLLLLQIYLGGLVAGLHAGLVYNTWPLIDGGLIPRSSDLFFNAPLWRNFFENVLTVQFDHRMLAYALTLFAVLHAADIWRTDRNSPALAGALLLALAMLLQAALGIVTLIFHVPLPLALAHQAMALVVLTISVLHAQRTYTRLELRSELKTA
jgi:cytochrome c oxidase assembly protein subunit 15